MSLSSMSQPSLLILETGFVMGGRPSIESYKWVMLTSPEQCKALFGWESNSSYPWWSSWLYSLWFGLSSQALKVKKTVAPLFTPSEDKLIIPWLSSISYLQIIRPNPIPSLFMLAVRFSLPNIWNSLGPSYFLKPLPVSTTLKSSIYFSAS